MIISVFSRLADVNNVTNSVGGSGRVTTCVYRHSHGADSLLIKSKHLNGVSVSGGLLPGAMGAVFQVNSE